ncbi:MAG: hypothetical protein ACI8Y7_000707 [Candidatus Woesearchaeota archaeon]|jgi:hypothetical protein
MAAHVMQRLVAPVIGARISGDQPDFQRHLNALLSFGKKTPVAKEVYDLGQLLRADPPLKIESQLVPLYAKKIQRIAVEDYEGAATARDSIRTLMKP